MTYGVRFKVVILNKSERWMTSWKKWSLVTKKTGCWLESYFFFLDLLKHLSFISACGPLAVQSMKMIGGGV